MEYPFIKCFSPGYIINPYTGERILTNCRKCEACLNAQGSSWSQLLQIQAEDFRYNYFVTLTYNNNYVPTCSAVYSDSHPTTFIVDDPFRFSSSDYVDKEGFVLDKSFNHFDCPLYAVESNLIALERKCNLPSGGYAVLCKLDAQKFIKRLRYYLKKYGIFEKIEYFIIGEYGPVHFRPHLHAQIYFNEQDTARVFGKALYQAWKYGYIHCEFTPRGEAASYVSSYLVSSSTLPPLYQAPAFKPFRLHSTHFAASFYQKVGKAIYEYDNRQVIQRVRRICDKEQRVSAWRNLTAIFYPKVRGFNRASDYELYKLYSCYRFARSFFKLETRDECLTISEMALLLCELQPKEFRFLTFDSIKMEYRSPENVAHDLYISKYFLTKVLPDGNIKYTLAYIDKIKRFYSDYELFRLKTFYQSQSDHPNVSFEFFYDNFSVSHQIYRNPLYSAFYSFQSMRAVNKVKHKRLNDLNQIFANG